VSWHPVPAPSTAQNDPSGETSEPPPMSVCESLASRASFRGTSRSARSEEASRPLPASPAAHPDPSHPASSPPWIPGPWHRWSSAPHVKPLGQAPDGEHGNPSASTDRHPTPVVATQAATTIAPSDPTHPRCIETVVRGNCAAWDSVRLASPTSSCWRDTEASTAHRRPTVEPQS